MRKRYGEKIGGEAFNTCDTFSTAHDSSNLGREKYEKFRKI